MLGKFKNILIGCLGVFLTAIGLFFAGKKAGKEDEKRKVIERGIEDSKNAKKRADKINSTPFNDLVDKLSDN